jgi:WD40 repeat protein
VEKSVTEGATLISHQDLPGGVYTVRFSADGNIIATAGQDGKIRFIESATGKVVSEFLPVPLSAAAQSASK